jgi:tetratricopeptide (TPR) repeat protein
MVHAAFGDAGGVSMSAPIAERAISELSRVVADDPMASEAAYLLAALFDHQGRFDDALPLYESVLDRQPTDAATARTLAVRLEALGSKRVAQALEQWIAVDATAGAAVAKRLVDLRREEGNQAALVRALDAAIRANPRDADLLGRRAAERERAGDHEGAVSDLEAAIATDPARVDGLIDMLTRTSGGIEPLLSEERVAHVADALARLDRPEHGKRELERLLALDPNRWERLANLFETRADHEDDRDKKAELQLRAAHLFLEEAQDPLRTLRVIAPLRKTKPDSIEALLLWARAKVAAGRADQAVPVLHEAAKSHGGKRSPLLASIYLEIGRAHLAVDEVVEAFDALESAFGADWRTRDVALLLGFVALDLGEEKAADRAFMAVTTLPTVPLGKEASGPGIEAATKAVAFYHLASMAVTKGDLSKARRLVSRALDGDPGHAASRALLAKISPRRAESAQ